MPDYGKLMLLPVKTRLITANSFYDMVFRQYQLVKEKSWKLYRNDVYFKTKRYNKGVENDLFTAISTPSSKPRFVYAHFLLPHAPFMRNQSGGLLPPDSLKFTSFKYTTNYFVYNLKYTNSLIRRITDSIQKHTGNKAIVLIQGDHGLRDRLYSQDVSLYLRNLNAVYFPDQDYRQLSDSMTSVNLFRIVLNRILGTQYPLLPDSSVHLQQQADL
jgi:hypothetical protein